MSNTCNMFTIKRTGIAIVFIISICSSINSIAQNIRIREQFDFYWQFHKGNMRIERAVKSGMYGGITDNGVEVIDDAHVDIAYTDGDKADVFISSEWEDVRIPHDWCVEGTFFNDSITNGKDGVPRGLVSHGYLPVGVGFYRKEFYIPSSDLGKKITIEFDGIFRNSTVWVNGHLIGDHQSGYTPSNYDLTDVLRYGDEGKNVILVKVDASDFEGWWYEGCGIYRHVWLIKTDRLHVARFGTYVTTPTISKDNCIVNIQTTLQNEYRVSKEAIITSTIIDSKGKVINEQRSSFSIKPFAKVKINQKGNIDNPQLWSPESPALYKVLTKVAIKGLVVDTYETSFGVRTAEVKEDGFYLNGEKYLIKGTSNHQDYAGVGVAVPDKVNEYRIKLLKRMGCNGYRTAHNPATPELMDACDQLGMLFVNENRLLESSENSLKDLETLILRDRNHPSVIMWSLENEEMIQGSTTGMRILQTLHDFTKNLDPTRQTTVAMNKRWNEANYSDVVDVVGYNYGQRGLQYVKDKEQYPDRLMIASETTSFTSTRGVYEDNYKIGHVSTMGNGVGWGMLPGKDWEHIVKYPYLSGQFAWTGFDYRGEPTPVYKWPCVVSHFGIMDLCGFPKDGYYAYKAAWTDTPVVHVFPHWNLPDKVDKDVKLFCYTNCEEVELFVNGKSVGRKKAIPFNRLEWNVIYKPGKLEAVGYKKGKVIVRNKIETTGRPAKIDLIPDTYTLNADGNDVAIVNISIKDRKGRVVPNADNLIKFHIEGPGKIIGTGNGNPSSHEPDKANQRKAFNGYCQVLVQTEKKEGEIRLEAISEELKSDVVLIKTTDNNVR